MTTKTTYVPVTDETLTTDMVEALKSEAAEHGDEDMARECYEWLRSEPGDARWDAHTRVICRAINAARAQAAE